MVRRRFPFKVTDAGALNAVPDNFFTVGGLVPIDPKDEPCNSLRNIPEQILVVEPSDGIDIKRNDIATLDISEVVVWVRPDTSSFPKVVGDSLP
jgi:hypothetical protein